MYSQCSSCSTLFRVTPQQLRVAGGRVRCSLCNHAFNALQTLYEQLPADLAAEFKLTEPEAAPASPLAPPAQASFAAALATALVRPEPVEATAVIGPADAPAAGGLASDDAPAPGSRSAPDGDPALGDGPLPDDDLALDDGPLLVGDPALGDGALLDEDPALGDGPLLDVGPVRAENPVLADSPGLGAAAGAAPFAWDIDSDLEFSAPPAPATGASWGWALGIVLLVALLLAQYAYAMRDELVRYASMRPALEQMCRVMGCALPPQRDLEQVRIVARNVSAHPEVAGALLVDVRIANEADFVQPFPQLGLTFFDGVGRQTGYRWFAPAEYLGDSPLLDLGMAPGAAAAVRLEVVDPGAGTENFEFAFR